jgi:hypothetical protein
MMRRADQRHTAARMIAELLSVGTASKEVARQYLQALELFESELTCCCSHLLRNRPAVTPYWRWNRAGP